MDAQTITAVCSACVAAISASISVYYSHRATQHADRSAQSQYEDNIRIWAERTVDITGHLVELLSDRSSETAFPSAKEPLLGDLRCQIDKGRWYFPNTHTEQKGASKHSAYRGIRQPIIDHLVQVYFAVTSADWATRASVRDAVEDLHRQFVSEIQHRLDPSKRDANYRSFVDQLSEHFVQESLSRPDRARTAGTRSNIGSASQIETSGLD